jgi:uncharacterized protein (DUF302 family)
MAQQRKKYGVGHTVKMDHGRAVERVTEALSKEGFGVLTTIDVSKTLKEKVGADIPKYVILGSCNPGLALEAVKAEPDIGLLMPCNVLVYETGNSGEVVIAAQDALFTLKSTENPKMDSIAQEVSARVGRAIDAVANG